MNFQGMIDKRNILLLFGCYCNKPDLILDEKYITTEYDYPEQFHKMIWGALINIVKKNKIKKITPIEIENELSLFKSSSDLWNVNNGYEYIENAIIETNDKIENIGLYRENVRKYSILRNANDVLKLDISFIYEEYDELDTYDIRLDEKKLKMNNFNKMTSKEVLAKINEKYDEFKLLWSDTFSDNYSFHAGEDIAERILEHKNQKNTWGYPFQSGYMTTIFRGMRPKKFIIRSSISGGGKIQK